MYSVEYSILHTIFDSSLLVIEFHRDCTITITHHYNSRDSELEIDYGTKKYCRLRLADRCEPDSNTFVARSFTLKELSCIGCFSVQQVETWRCQYFSFCHFSSSSNIICVCFHHLEPSSGNVWSIFETLQFCVQISKDLVQRKFSGKYGWFCGNLGGTTHAPF